MKKKTNYVFLSLFLISFSNAFGQINLSLSEHLWVKKNILKPDVNLIFIITISKDMLENHPVTETKTFPSIDYKSITKSELTQYIALNPNGKELVRECRFSSEHGKNRIKSGVYTQ